MSNRKRVVIVGAGFAGLEAAKMLGRQRVDVVLIDRNNYHTFTPLLYQVATCGLDPSSVAYPVRSIFRKYKNVRFLLGDVVGVNTDEKFVTVNTRTSGTRDEHYDYLFVAAGSKTNYFGDDSIQAHSFGLRDMDDAISIRDHVLKLFEKAAWTMDSELQTALMTMVVVGGGPTGLETAGALYELYNHVLDREYDKYDAKLTKARVILVEAMDQVLAPYPERLRISAQKQLEEIGVEVYTGAFVEEVGSNYLTLRDGTRIDTYTIVWATGVLGETLADMLGVELQRGARIPVEPTMQVTGLGSVYAAGDIAYLIQPETERPYPGMIPVAQQQGRLVAKNIMADIQFDNLEEFEYFDRGIMATIGRNHAVAYVFNRIQMTGFIAWVAWLVLHLITLIGFRNRLLTLVTWTWNYIFYDRSVRLIVNKTDEKVFETDQISSPKLSKEPNAA